MKKVLLIVLCLSFLVGSIYADSMAKGPSKKAIETPKGRPILPSREVPAFEFTVPPTAIMTSYYDYMMGSYNGLPLRVIPDAEGGYFMTYHGKRQVDTTRRVFYTFMEANGAIVTNNEITSFDKLQGYPTMVIDPISAKPLYAWHVEVDPADEYYDVEFTSDAFFFRTAGMFNDVETIVNNPIEIITTINPSTTDNEFLWPTAQIGPSPINGKRRIYVVSRNTTTHGQGPSENIYMKFADFDGEDIENAIPFTWYLSTIPLLNEWNNDTGELRRANCALTTDNSGNVYYIGYHNAWDVDGNYIDEDEINIFKCGNYGQGEWTRLNLSGTAPTWNPPEGPGSTVGWLDSEGVPWTDDELSWSIGNSSHLNAVVDNYGRLIFGGLWVISAYNGNYYPAFHFVKAGVFDPYTQEFSIQEIYPQKDPSDDFNEVFTPWDMEAPWGEVDEWGGTAPNTYPLAATIYPFCHWDDSLHNDGDGGSMLFHYNNVKVSEVNEQGMMVATWQDSQNAKYINEYQDEDYAAYAQTPEIYISVSPNNGKTWSEPIVLNNVDTPAFAGLKPMWVYPADKVIYVSTEINGDSIVYTGKIGLAFYDDFTWGSNSNDPPAHPTNDGGKVMFTELLITFPPFTSNEDVTIPAISKMLNQNYPNPFNPETTISFDMPIAGNAKLDIYNVKGQIVKTLFNGTAPYGKTKLVWNGTDNNHSNVPSGIYFYRLTTANNTETRKMMLMK